MNTVLLLAATYIITGIALTGYDFAAPPLHAKMYVIRRDYSEALKNWFLWPISAVFEIYQLAALRRVPLRHLLGVLALGLGIMTILRFVFLLSALLLPWIVPAYLIAPAVAIAVSPIISGIVMPKHGHERTRSRRGGEQEINPVPFADMTRQRDIPPALRSLSSALWEQLPSWVALPDIPSLKRINALMIDQWRVYCHAYVFALAASTELRRDRLFFGSEREKIITLGVAQMMLESRLELARRHAIPELNRAKALEASARDLKEARAAARAFIQALAAEQGEPDRPLLDYFAHKIGVPPPQREVFDALLRTFTKDALIKLSSATA